jgi:hypothetical protein
LQGLSGVLFNNLQEAQIMSNVGINEPRPPYVVFETHPEEDREASIEQGKIVYRDIDYAIITPMGSKDRIVKVAKEWLANLRREVQNGRFKEEWYEGYTKSYDRWKDGQEDPVQGTALKDWPGLTPSQLRNLNGLGLKSVEDLAACNEETIQRMGMGGRELKHRASNWLMTANDTGKVSEKISALETENQTLKTQNEDLAKKLELAMFRLDKLETLNAPPVPPTPEPKGKGSKDIEFGN